MYNLRGHEILLQPKWLSESVILATACRKDDPPEVARKVVQNE